MNPQRVEAVLLGLRKGLSRTVAAEAAGVSKDTLRNWAQRSPKFAAQLTQAEAQAQSVLVGIVLAAAAKMLPNTWQAAAWLLERRWPELYGQRARVEISVDVRAEARRIAALSGFDEAAILAEAEAILAGMLEAGPTKLEPGSEPVTDPPVEPVADPPVEPPDADPPVEPPDAEPPDADPTSD